jgi:hypothetical protein
MEPAVTELGAKPETAVADRGIPDTQPEPGNRLPGSLANGVRVGERLCRPALLREPPAWQGILVISDLRKK